MPEYLKPGLGGFKSANPLSVSPGRPGEPRVPGPRFRQQPQELRRGTPSLTGASEASVSRTTLPTKQHIRCFECTYEFTLTGRMSSTHCPKCRTSLDLAGYTIDTECHDTLKTLGKIKITSQGVVTSSHLLGTDIELAGKVTNSTVEALHELILCPGADFTRGHFKAIDLKIEAGGQTTFRQPAVFRNVEVIGTFTAPLYVTELMTIRVGAMFAGSVCGGRLIVEEGATFIADANISPEGLAEAKKMKEKMTVSPLGVNERVLVTPVASFAPVR